MLHILCFAFAAQLYLVCSEPGLLWLQEIYYYIFKACLAELLIGHTYSFVKFDRKITDFGCVNLFGIKSMFF